MISNDRQLMTTKEAAFIMRGSGFSDEMITAISGALCRHGWAVAMEDAERRLNEK